jgi:pyridoxal phosphate enzyme (YggS family)
VIDPAAVVLHVADVRRRIEAAGGDDRVRLVAVTKGFGPEAVAAAVAAGVADVGESYAQEAVAKWPAVAEPRPRLHFIGHLQSNKVRALAPFVDLWQSIDRPSVGDEVARRRPGAHVLVQVNVSDEPQKGGCEPSRTGALVAHLRAAGLVVDGLMCIGLAGGPQAARPGFRLLRSLADDLSLAERSMGMTDDLEAAVQEGATMVRVGTALFGPRPGRAQGAH